MTELGEINETNAYKNSLYKSKMEDNAMHIVHNRNQSVKSELLKGYNIRNI